MKALVGSHGNRLGGVRLSRFLLLASWLIQAGWIHPMGPVGIKTKTKARRDAYSNRRLAGYAFCRSWPDQECEETLARGELGSGPLGRYEMTKARGVKTPGLVWRLKPVQSGDISFLSIVFGSPQVTSRGYDWDKGLGDRPWWSGSAGVRLSQTWLIAWLGCCTLRASPNYNPMWRSPSWDGLGPGMTRRHIWWEIRGNDDEERHIRCGMGWQRPGRWDFLVTGSVWYLEPVLVFGLSSV